MTQQRRLKRQIRERMAKTGERYAAARGAILGDSGASDDAHGDPPSARYNRMSDEPVVRATGRGHEEWFALLDAAGAASMPHPEIAAHLVEDHGVDGWWAQHVTVAYEQARGLRVKHQRPDGFSVTKSKTIAAPIREVYRAFVEEAQRARWLDGDLEISSCREARTVNGRWDGGPERLTVRLQAKGEAKTQVALGHLKLPDAETAEAAKTAWGERLDRLAGLLD